MALRMSSCLTQVKCLYVNKGDGEFVHLCFSFCGGLSLLMLSCLGNSELFMALGDGGRADYRWMDFIFCISSGIIFRFNVSRALLYGMGGMDSSSMSSWRRQHHL